MLKHKMFFCSILNGHAHYLQHVKITDLHTLYDHLKRSKDQ